MPMESFDNLVELVENAKADVAKAEKGNRAAGTRVRKAMQEMKNLAQQIRKEMLALRESEEEAAAEAAAPPQPAAEAPATEAAPPPPPPPPAAPAEEPAAEPEAPQPSEPE